MYFTLEKLSHGIVIQIALDEKPIRETIQKNPRENVFIEPLVEDDCKENLRLTDVVDWLYSPTGDKEERKRDYNLFSDNCQHFAERVLKFTAKSEEYPGFFKTKEHIYEDIVEKVKMAKQKQEQ